MRTEKILPIYYYILRNFDYDVYYSEDNYIIAFPKNGTSNILICCHVDTVRDRKIIYPNYTNYYNRYSHYTENPIRNIEFPRENIDDMDYIYKNLDKEIIQIDKYFETDIYLLIDRNTENIIKCVRKINDNRFKGEILGGDDRAGLYIITHILYYTNVRPIVGLFNGEESGCIGSRKCAENKEIVELLKKKVTFLIQFDRREIINFNDEDINTPIKPKGNYVNYLNNVLSPYITQKMESLEYTLSSGSISDVKILSEATKIQHINMSCGFVNEHSSEEKLILSALERTINAALELLNDPVLNNNKFIMIKKKNKIIPNYYEYGYPISYHRGQNINHYVEYETYEEKMINLNEINNNEFIINDDDDDIPF
jgi:hypothetical protein